MIEMKRLVRKEVVTAFLRYKNRILLVCRSKRVGSYQGRWSGISGYLEELEPQAQVMLEIREETGLADTEVRFVCYGHPLEVPAPEMGICWIVHPFLFDIEDPDAIRLNWENLEHRWVLPEELEKYTTVPALGDALQRVLNKS